MLLVRFVGLSSKYTCSCSLETHCINSFKTLDELRTQKLDYGIHLLNLKETRLAQTLLSEKLQPSVGFFHHFAVLLQLITKPYHGHLCRNTFLWGTLCWVLPSILLFLFNSSVLPPMSLQESTSLGNFETSLREDPKGHL